MSDTRQGPGWWQANDGKWYPPDSQPAPAGWWQASDSKWYPPPSPEQANRDPAEPQVAHLPLTGKGVTGRVVVDDHFVTINRKGALAKANYGFTRGEKRIPIDSIAAVQFKAPKLSNGYIQFTLGGGNEGTRGIMQATKDENSVLFNHSHRQEFERIRDHIERRIIGRHHPAAQPPAQEQAPGAGRSVAEELTALANLRDQGILTAEEFEQQKARLLQ